ncbi:MAG: DNA-binding domain-containing protein [Gammaproteobacteria bacterium]|nr:DNA-binding domain-containing protein [Gammaproteobacteria bacterium]MBU2478169.1 DNA-binding domain-containing protein [Gammaproteobacteria bacterium]
MTEALHNLQQTFQSHVLHGDASMLDLISSNVLPSPEARLSIYSNAYRLRLLEALATDYPGLHTLAGDDLFEQIGRSYIAAYPSTHYSIRYFGQHLGRFLAETAPYTASPVLAEMARLEWALSLAFDSADDDVLDEAALATLPPESWPGMQLRLHASVQRQNFQWNVAELWTAIDQQRNPEPPQRYLQPQSWLIWRRGYQNYFRRLDDTEAWALDYVQAGNNFAMLCEGLCAYIEPEQIGMLAAGYLKGWVRAGIVVQLQT